MKTLLLRHPQNNYQMRLYQWNLVCEEFSYQIINTSTLNQAVFCYYWKFTKIIIIKKTLVSVVTINAEMHFFWIHLRHTWLNVFGLTLAALSFPTFTFSIGIKLFIRHPVVLSGILILLKQVDDFLQLLLWCILKDRQLRLHKFLKYWVVYPVIA